MINAQLTGIMVILIGFYGLITKNNPIKQILAVNVMSTGLILFFMGVGYVKGDNIAIIPNESIVDPLPATLMLTTLVVDVALTSLALVLILKMEEES